MLDSEQKRMLYNKNRFAVYMKFFMRGLKSMAGSLFKIGLVALLITGYVFALINVDAVAPPKPDDLRDMNDYFWLFYDLFVTALFGFAVYTVIMMYGVPLGSKKYNENFQRSGISNDAGEAPALISKDYDKSNPRMKKLTFYTRGLPLSYWNDNKDVIESAQDIIIDRIEQGYSQNYIVVYAVDGKYQLPEKINWSKDYMSNSSSTLVLGESVASRVDVNLGKTPHMLLAGSTGSGKTVLLKLLLMQCVKKNHEVFIADFKGGVDFNRSWRTKKNVTLILDNENLKKHLDDILTRLHTRKEIFYNGNYSNINDYNERTNSQLHRIVFACDEVAELLDKTGLSKKAKEEALEIESKIATIARLGRAFGIHLILATQRPDANIICGQIKNNIDFRACSRSDNVLSQVVLDKTDASDLIGKNSCGRFLTNTDVLFQAFYFDDKEDW